MRWTLIVLFFSLLPYSELHSQQSDSSSGMPPKKHSRFMDFFRKAFSRSSDSSMRTVRLIKPEAQFLPYQGKGIRRIIVKEYEETAADTVNDVEFFGKDFIEDHLYWNTKEWVIRNNLFIKERTVLNAYMVADNERYLRSLNYIHDARIMVKQVRGKPDSIDLVIVTKSFFSIIAELNALSKGHFKAKFGDANLFGTGQRIEFTTLNELSRAPHFGYAFLYRNNTIANTFINASAGYSKISPDLQDGTADEHSLHAEIERPLVSQYLHVAGAVRFSINESHNNYMKADSLFYDYRVKNFDAWLGYNLGVNKFLSVRSGLNRGFISMRYLRSKFNKVPFQVKDSFNFRFNDKEAILGQFTLFQQNYYRTSYIFGFGITEDIPFGYNIALTIGWYKQLSLRRFYTGIDFNRYLVMGTGNVVQYFVRSGGFWNKGKFEDAALLAGTSILSRLYSARNMKMRQFIRLSYTKQFNRIGLDPLSINNIFGLPYVPQDLLGGNQRVSMHTESVFFLKYQLLGFRFAPFASADVCYFAPEKRDLFKPALYFGLGGGLRTRNENIVLGTVEFRFMYFPPKPQQIESFRFSILTNLRFRSTFNYVKAPDIIEVNSDRDNNIY
jgi:hypothetical protein